ncbi:MAG: site-2 protease family protein [Candidatus Dormibacteria bacterium]
MPATPEAPDPTPVPDAGQTPAHPAGAPWEWPAYPPNTWAPGQPDPHPDTIYPPPGTGYAPHPGTLYPPPGAGYAPAPYPAPGTGYTPPGWGQQGAAAPGQAPGTPAKRRGGFVGGLLTALAFIAKLGYFGKFGLTAITMVVAVGAYALIFGWAFAVGLVLIIFVHEMGHFLTSRVMGVPMSAPVFIPFLGAFTTAGRGLTSDRRREAIVAIAGPVTGFLATLAVYLWALAQDPLAQGVAFAFSLSYFGFFITLFNLIPMLPLDGGRVTSAVSKWFNLAGLVIVAALLVSEWFGATVVNPILILILILGGYSVWGRFQAARLGREAPSLPLRTRVLIGAGYIALLALSGLFMSLSAGWLSTHGLVNLA